MPRKIIVALLITVVLLAVARRLSKNNPEYLVAADGDVTVSHTTVFEHVGGGRPVIEIGVSGDDSVKAYLIYSQPSGQEVARVEMAGDGAGSYSGFLPDSGKGERLLYSFEVVTQAGRPIALPGDGSSVLLKYKGEVSTLVLVLHVIFMFGSFFFMVLAGLYAIDLLRGLGGKRSTAIMVRWLMIFIFIGGWPLGFILNRQRFGPVWEGFPFGWDVTDNKTQIMLVIWIVTILLARGSFFGIGKEKDLVGEAGFARAVILSLVLSLAIFLIPHSL